MAIKKIKAEKKVAPKTDVVLSAKVNALLPSAKFLLKNPRITEKATMLAEGSIYTFNVAKNATKSEIEKAVKELFKITPKKVRMITIKPRNVIVRGKRGTQSGGKKALVYLKKGDKLSFV